MQDFCSKAAVNFGRTPNMAILLIITRSKSFLLKREKCQNPSKMSFNSLVGGFLKKKKKIMVNSKNVSGFLYKFLSKELTFLLFWLNESC